MSTKTSHAPEFTEAQFRYLEKVFQRAVTTPQDTLAQIMHSAGEQAVLRHIQERVKVWSRSPVLPG